MQDAWPEGEETGEAVDGSVGAGTVIAVNTDLKAPVFGHADYGVVGNWETIVQEMEALI